MIKPHGGMLVNRTLSGVKRDKILQSNLPRISVIDDIILDIEKIAIGAYSPLTGFMTRKDFTSTVHNMRLANGVPWTIPIFLPVEKTTVAKLKRKDRFIVQDKNNRDIALVEVNDIYSFPKDRWADKVYGTRSVKHPGVNRLSIMHDKLVGGNIWLLNRAKFAFEKENLSPSQTRHLIKQKGWKSVAGFQTRNVPHRAHEYLQKVALTFTDGLLIHPIIGWKKDGDFSPKTIIKAYKALIKNYYPRGSVLFSGLAMSMRYAGPAEAVFHAIVRKNYGCTHFIVGRDHAGVGTFYDKYDAHRIFDKIPDLGIEIMALRGPYYCRRCEAVTSDKICPHPKSSHNAISGTLIRKLLAEGGKIPEYLLRPEVIKVVKECSNNIFIK